ncbi:hypothetical protein BCR32DRAFT_287960 [Anaeromyces robustus]|uniref:Uncharacterized protein n=1 Tax=Anaeromyces robustus TaxID=1754192 RepID=A0A1Y1VR41_9FUNG|nr:hypothetical protein BCR32DRAFT_287960 [Anaeromyces robustus]|eukprot:ORX62504.1 hypothetical protein BCR32DRAFT_287960 [Anaeromyces robustus]
MNIKIEIKYSLLNFVVYICIFCNSFVYTSVTFLNKKNEFNQFKPIKLKDSGEQIKKIQEKLISLKYDCGLNEPDDEATELLLKIYSVSYINVKRLDTEININELLSQLFTCGDDVKTMYSDPGEMLVVKNAIYLRTYDHCDQYI